MFYLVSCHCYSKLKHNTSPVPWLRRQKNAPLILEKLGRARILRHNCRSRLLKQKANPILKSFLAAADSIGVLPQNAIGFEDAQSGIDGLKAAGIYAVGLSASQPLIGADMQVSEMTELSVDALLNR